MELLPALEVVEGEADITVRALWRRYEGTYFNGTSYEPGIVAEQVFYDWDASGQYWAERQVGSRPILPLTEDLPALAELPTRLVRPGTPEADADMWLVGELPGEKIFTYYEPSTGKTWLRYGDSIQAVEGMLVCMPQFFLPELHWADLDGDGNRELAVISAAEHGTGVSESELTVYEWDGEAWSWTTLDPSGLIQHFNANRIYEFYEDGTAYISYEGHDLLLDLSDLRERGYWDSVPDVCVLSEEQSYYRYEDGSLTLVLGGEILDTGGHFLHGYCFAYNCPVSYYSGSLTGYRGSLTASGGELRSDFAAELPPPELTDAWREVLTEIWDKCEKTGENAFAVHDVDGDGREELIVRWMPEGAIASAWGTSVYGSDGAERFHGYGRLTFYSNGAVSVPWSHNQGAACAIWPYDLYQYTPGWGYTEVGSARARSSDVPGFEEVAYADLDGDGMVYYIGEDAFTEEHPVDNDVYEVWRDRYLAGTRVLPVRYFPLTEELVSGF